MARSCTRRLTNALLTVGGILGCGISAHAFMLANWTPDGGTPLRWNLSGQQPSEFFDNGAVRYRLIGTGLFAVPSPAYVWAILNAFQTWEDSTTSSVAFTRGSDIAEDPWDEGFSIGFSDALQNTHWGGNMAGASGLTSWTWSGDYFIDMDIAFASTLAWTTDGSGHYDLEETALHEIGHALGLEHDPHAQSVMSYVGPWSGTAMGAQSRRLTENDHIALALLYPEAGVLEQRGSIGGSITVNGTGVHQAQIGAFDSAGHLIATTVSKDGHYRLEGLAPGTYTLRAFNSFGGDYNFGLYQSSYTLPWWQTAATPFLSTPVQDAEVEVTAGVKGVRDLQMLPGTPVMQATWTTRKSDGWRVAQQVLRMQRGETARIGIIGSAFPVSDADIVDLSLTGGGVTLSNRTFSGPTTTGEAPQADWPHAGESAIVFDCAVAADAKPGIRALLLTNSAGERMIVFGLLEIYEPGSAAASTGAQTAVAELRPDGEQPVLQIQLSPEQGAGARIRAWRVQNTGSGSNEHVRAWRVYHDNDADGTVDADDAFIGSAALGGTVLSAVTVADGATAHFVVTFDLVGAPVGSVYTAALDIFDVWGVSSSIPLPTAALPLSGHPLTVVDGHSFPLELAPGWNLVSVPLNPDDNAVASVFPPSVVVHPVWEYQSNGYVAATTIVPGKGYWVFGGAAAANAPLVITGTNAADGAWPLNPGWNLVGPFDEIQATLPSVLQPIWRWSTFPSGYVSVPASGLLLKGSGYWVRPAE